jgi:hypothetical protein
MRAIHIETNPENHGSAYAQICARRTSVECGREGKVVRKVHRVQWANQDGLFVPCAPHNRLSSCLGPVEQASYTADSGA